MSRRGWFSRACELEREGRLDEARALFEANTSAEQRAAIARSLAALANINPEAVAEAEEIMKRFRALDDWPEGHSKRIIWEQFWDATPAFLAPFWRHLPDPTAKPGRPKDSGKITDEMLAEMDRRHELRERPTTAAKAIIGKMAGQKNRADHLVRVWKRSRGIK